MIDITNSTGIKIDKSFLKTLAKNVLKRENRIVDISIVLVGEEKIRELNKKYRGKDEATDVLSFGDNLNEIVICPAVAKKELEKVLIHGILHLLGYEHGDLMESRQEYYLELFKY